MFKAIIDTNLIIRYIVKDDGGKADAVEKFFLAAKEKGGALFVPGIVIFEVVFVLEKIYSLDRALIRGAIEGILNTPIFRCDMDSVIRAALVNYDEKKVKFADAVIAAWGLERGIKTIYTYDERDFRKIKGLDVKKP